LLMRQQPGGTVGERIYAFGTTPQMWRAGRGGHFSRRMTKCNLEARFEDAVYP
jgi:hypothetical protein